MGREVRRVPPNWNHPTYGQVRKDKESPYYCRAQRTSHRDDKAYLSLYDETHESAAQDWVRNFLEWHAEGKVRSDICNYYWEYSGPPPKEEMYRLYKDDDATWYQLYETVSEGTPVSPPFETKEELVEYLSTKGDFWQQSAPAKYGEAFQPYSRQAAEYLVNGGYAPTMVVTSTNKGVVIQNGAEAFAKGENNGN